MNHISINVLEEIKNILPNTLEKDLQDNEQICPICHGLGIMLNNNIYGVKGETYEIAKKSTFPYNNQSITFCNNCYNGVIKLCKYCGKHIKKDCSSCDCEYSIKEQEEKKRIKYQDKIEKAQEVDLESLNSEWLCCDVFNGEYSFFYDIEEFVQQYYELYELYLDEIDGMKCSFEDYYNKYIPKTLWVCSEKSIFIDAGSIIEDACEELHEDAYNNIPSEDENELQNLLNAWCKNEESNTKTYYPSFEKYVKVDVGWFKEYIDENI